MIGLPPVNAFVLQRTPYREHSLLLRLLTVEQGQVTALYRGNDAPYLYQPYHAELSGTAASDWRTLNHLELAGPVLRLTGRYSYLALYLNELCGRLLPRQVATEDLFGTYYATLKSLQAGAEPEPALRYFERRLLMHLGFGVDFTQDTQGQPVRADRHYQFDGVNAFSAVADLASGALPGAALLAVDTNDYTAPAARKAAKWVFRQALQHHLGAVPLRSRALFQRPETANSQRTRGAL